MREEITIKANKVRRNKKVVKIAKILILLSALLLGVAFLFISLIYNGGNFSITLDRDLYIKNGIIIYDDPDYKVFRSELIAPVGDSFSNTSYKWFPDDLDQHDGSHNGKNYLAYTFYIENMGEAVADYWAEIIIDDVSRHLDEAIRVRVYRNGVPTTYAALAMNGKPEPMTVAFMSDEVVMRENIKSFKPGDKNKYTIVIWLEGTDPECTDNLIGGEIKIHMAFNSENIKPYKKQ